MPRSEKLLELQRAVFRALREPVFGESRARTELPARDGRVSAAFEDTANRFISPSASLRPVERLELYHRQYWYRLLDSLEEDFPALKHLLGAEGFWRLIESYLEATPSRSYTLRHLGAGLADFIGWRSELAGPHPVHTRELARLEYALCESFEAAEWSPAPPARLAGQPLSLQPHLKLLACRTPADELWKLDTEEAIPGPLLVPSGSGPRFHLAVYRFQFRLLVERLDPAAFRLLRAIAETGELEAAIERSGLADVGDQTRANVSDWFRTWIGRGWLCSRKAAARRIPVSFAPSKASRVSLGRGHSAR